MKNFIVETFEKNPELNTIKLDDKYIEKSLLKFVSNDFIEISENKYINLHSVHQIEFLYIPTLEERLEIQNLV